MGAVSTRKQEAARRAFHAAWEKPIDQLECSGEAFRALRRDLLNLSQKDAARLLRVAKSSIKNWESGKYKTQFAPYLALLLISESKRYRTPSDPGWYGWQFTDRYDPITKRTDCVVSSPAGVSFALSQLEDFCLSMQKAEWLKSAIATLQSKVDALTSENTELREQFRDSGLTAEMHEMQDRLDALLSQLPPLRCAS